MTTVIQFAILGLGTGAIFALLSAGVILIFKGSGILNFGQGAIAMIGGFVFYDLHVQAGWAFAPALVVAAAAGAMVGVATYWAFVRRLSGASQLAKTIVTLGLMLTLEGAGQLIWGTTQVRVPSSLPASTLHAGSIVIPIDRPILLAIGAAITLAIWAVFRFTPAGLATTAMAESPRGASALGWSPHKLALVNWGVGGLLAGVAGALIAPITGLQVATTSLLIIPALSAALIGGFTSLPLALAGAVALGMAQSEVAEYVHVDGAADALPFLVIVLLLVVRGKTLPGRGGVSGERLPVIGTGRVRPLPAIAVSAVMLWLLLLVMQTAVLAATTTSLIFAIIMLSVVVLTGYAGQLALAPFTLAGLGAYVAGKLFATGGVPFELALLAGLLCAIPIGVAVGLPALRTRGVTLAVVTLGLATAISEVLFHSGGGVGGDSFAGTELYGIDQVTGKHLPDPKLLGIDVQAFDHPSRYAVLCLAFLAIAALAVANLRRGRAGRRLIAVRSNERGASALGISIVESKLYAFVLACVIASLGGILYAFANPSVLYSNFDAFTNILLVAYVIIAGVGFLAAPVVAGLLFVVGGVGVYFVDKLLGDVSGYIAVLTGINLMLIITLNPDGIVPPHIRLFDAIGRRLRIATRRRHATDVADVAAQVAATRAERVPAATLDVRDLTVRYGGVVAVDAVSLRVGPGEIVGLIGPNGAGKTTLIDAISGFVGLTSGEVRLNGERVERLPAHERARRGLSRSFQSLELFEDLTIYDNLRTACDRRDRLAYLQDLMWPTRPPLTGEALAAIAEFDLERDLLRRPGELSFSQRRLIATARAVANAPSIVMLDEPAAGMSDVRRRELSTVVRRLAQEWGIGVLVVDHDMPFVMDVCDRIVVLNFGRKIADAEPEQIRKDPAVISAYLRSDAEEDSEAAAHAASERRRSRGAADEPIVLAARELAVGYFEHSVVEGLDFEIRRGEVVSLLGANRAGKTTTLLTLAGELLPIDGEVHWLGERVGKRVPLHRRAREGMGYLSDERAIFSQLTVEQNLKVGRPDTELALTLFPELRELLKRRAGLLSGGEQQMLGLARALARHPKLLLVDEMSLGLAPRIVTRLMEALRHAADEQGVAVVLVEQHVQQALGISDSVCVIAGGRMTLAGSVELVAGQVESAFLADLLGRRPDDAAISAGSGRSSRP